MEYLHLDRLARRPASTGEPWFWLVIFHQGPRTATGWFRPGGQRSACSAAAEGQGQESDGPSRSRTWQSACASKPPPAGCGRHGGWITRTFGEEPSGQAPAPARLPLFSRQHAHLDKPMAARAQGCRLMPRTIATPGREPVGRALLALHQKPAGKASFHS